MWVTFPRFMRSGQTGHLVVVGRSVCCSLLLLGKKKSSNSWAFKRTTRNLGTTHHTHPTPAPPCLDSYYFSPWSSCLSSPFMVASWLSTPTPTSNAREHHRNRRAPRAGPASPEVEREPISPAAAIPSPSSSTMALLVPEPRPLLFPVPSTNAPTLPVAACTTWRPARLLLACRPGGHPRSRCLRPLWC